jgi:hypothetical protein
MGSSVPELLLGAFLALAGGVATIVVEKIWESKGRRAEMNAAQSALAFSALVKLAEIAAWSRKIGRSIDECFETAEGTRAQTLDPGVKVQPLVGSTTAVDRLSSEELALILAAKDAGLLERILALQGNYRASFEIVSHFNLKRQEYSNFMRENVLGGEMIDGLLAGVELDGTKKMAVDSRIAELNQLVAFMIEGAKEDQHAAQHLISRLQTSLNSMSGLSIPEISFVRGER